jgi:hypothetical protein
MIFNEQGENFERDCVYECKTSVEGYAKTYTIMMLFQRARKYKIDDFSETDKIFAEIILTQKLLSQGKLLEALTHDFEITYSRASLISRLRAATH